MKKILVVSPKFYSYRDSIVIGLRKKCFIVDFFDERPSNNFFMKVILRLKLHRFVSPFIKRHYEELISDVEKYQYDIILFVNVEAVGSQQLEKIKSVSPGSELVLYMWDSAKNKPKFPQLIKYFDRAFSFDPEDVNKYKELEFLPLFYDEEFAKEKLTIDKVYDFSFVGAGHSDRCNILKVFADKSDCNNFNYKFYIFFHSRILYFLQFIRSPNSLLSLRKYCFFSTMPFTEVNDIFNKSKCIIDVSHNLQSGLTMRTIEALGSNQKLITTNSSIKNYDFYDDSMIFIIDRDDVRLPSLEFVRSNSEYPASIRKKYSLSHWLDIVVGKALENNNV